MIRSVQHPNFATVREIYRAGEGYYVVYEYLPRSLYEFVGCSYLDDDKLAAITRRQAGQHATNNDSI